MLKYVAQRVVLMLMTLLIITCICFVLIRMLPLPALDPSDPHAEIIETRREALGYNKPYMVQFGIFLKNVLTEFNWGVSDKLYFGQDVLKIFVTKLPASMIVNLYSILVSIPVGITLGIFAYSLTIVDRPSQSQTQGGTSRRPVHPKDRRAAL